VPALRLCLPCTQNLYMSQPFIMPQQGQETPNGGGLYKYQYAGLARQLSSMETRQGKGGPISAVLARRVTATENQIATAPVERAVVFDEAGGVLVDKKGERTEVSPLLPKKSSGCEEPLSSPIIIQEEPLSRSQIFSWPNGSISRKCAWSRSESSTFLTLLLLGGRPLRSGTCSGQSRQQMPK